MKIEYQSGDEHVSRQADLITTAGLAPAEKMVRYQTVVQRKLRSQKVTSFHLMLIVGLTYMTVYLILMIYNSFYGSLQAEQVNLKIEQNIVRWYQHERLGNENQLEHMKNHSKENATDETYEKWSDNNRGHMANLGLELQNHIQLDNMNNDSPGDVRDGVHIERYQERRDDERHQYIRLGSVIGSGANVSVGTSTDPTWNTHTDTDTYLAGDADTDADENLAWDVDTDADTYLKMYRSYCENHFTPESYESPLELCPCVPHDLGEL